MKVQEYAAILTILGGRKFVFALATGISAVALFAFGKLSEPGFIELAQWVAVGYLGANSFGKLAGSIGGKNVRRDGEANE